MFRLVLYSFQIDVVKLPHGKKMYIFFIQRNYIIEFHVIIFCCHGYQFGLNTNFYINIFFNKRNSGGKKKKKKKTSPKQVMVS